MILVSDILYPGLCMESDPGLAAIMNDNKYLYISTWKQVEIAEKMLISKDAEK